MKNSILNLGKALNKADQKEINGGDAYLGCSYVGQACGKNGRCVIPYQGALHLSCHYLVF